jgi:Tol biopolymer transport system component
MGEDGQRDIWTIDADGGSLRRLTEDPGEENTPSWSADGRSIYFASNREEKTEIWRVPSAGGPAERVTRTGGFLPFESADGQTLFFKKGYWDSPLMAMALPGGPERQVIDCVPPFGFAVGRAGVYHFGCGSGPDAPLSLLDTATGRDRLLGRVERPGEGLAVSLDGKTILYTRKVREGSDLMMIENFR